MGNTREKQENRSAVRVVDRILFAYDPVTLERFKQIAEDFSNGIPPYNQEGMADIQIYIGAQNALGRIREKDKDLAEFLQHLDAKMNVILKSVRGEKSPMDRLLTHEVNLSGAGLAFFSDKPIAPNAILALHLVLLPDYTYVYCFAKVVNCAQGKSRDSERPYLISLKFVLIMEEDREKLIQHNFKQQSLALRQRRKQS